jgi:hypothetical protein
VVINGLLFIVTTTIYVCIFKTRYFKTTDKHGLSVFDQVHNAVDAQMAKEWLEA